MNKRIGYCLTLISVLLVSGSAQAGAMIDELVVFGDSLSDSGNVFALTTASPDHVPDPPSPPYFDGRASNGPNWVDQLADGLGLPRPVAYLRDPTGTNYAFAGATTGDGVSTRFPSPTFPPNPPLEVDNVGKQIDTFLANNGGFRADQLVTLWAGADDLRDVSSPADLVQIVDNLEQHIRVLDDHGARRVVVPTQLDSGLAPFFDMPGTPEPAIISAAVLALDQLLDARLQQLSADPSLSIDIIGVDMFALIQQLADGSFDFVNTTNGWLLDLSQGAAESPDPNDYVFFDVIHPTSRAHGIISDTVLAATVAEPTIPALLTLAILMLLFRNIPVADRFSRVHRSARRLG